MEPMKPMTPMKPMEPMKPMDFGQPWWPADLGSPATSGAQNDMRYAVFPDKQRMIVERDGTTTTYDTGDHRISGVSQSGSHDRTLAFTSQQGDVDLSQLKQV